MLYMSGTEQIRKSRMKYLRDRDNVLLGRDMPKRYASLVALKSFFKVVFFPSITRIIQVQVRTPNKT